VQLALVRIVPADFSSTLAPDAPIILATGVDASRFGFHLDSASLPGGTDVIWSDAAAGMRSISYAHADRHGAVSTPSAMGTWVQIPGASVARRTEREGAILYTASLTTGGAPPDVLIQRIGCD
jgi:hypothetical protein